MSTENAGKNKEPKILTIIINGTAKSVEKERMSFEEIVALAYETPPTGDGVQFTIQYTK